MAHLTRRSLLQHAPLSAASLTVLPAISAVGDVADVAMPRSLAPSARSMVIHVNDVATGEMRLLVGTREIVLRDERLVARFIEAAGSAGDA
jgi:hypothetical protein